MLRALAAFLCIAVLGVPLWRLTRTSAANGPPATREVAAMRAVHLALNFTSPPTSLRVRHLGRDIWVDAAPALALEKTVTIAWPREGVDLRFEVKFSADAPLSAMRVRLTGPAGEEHEQSAWGRGEIDEVLSFR